MPAQGASMTVGNLVRITRASIGIPIDSVGLIIEKHRFDAEFDIWVVKLVRRPHTRRYLARDLEIVSS
jgi:hypothetical protein